MSRKVFVFIILTLFNSYTFSSGAIPDSFGEDERGRFSSLNNRFYDFIYPYLNDLSGYKFLLTVHNARMVTGLMGGVLGTGGGYLNKENKIGKLSIVGGIVSFAWTLMNSNFEFHKIYNLSELAVLGSDTVWSYWDWLKSESYPEVYALDDDQHIISNSVAKLTLVIPPAVKEYDSWLSNNARWYWDKTFYSNDDLQLTSVLSDGLAYIDFEPSRQSYGGYFYDFLFGNGIEKGKHWVDAMKGLSDRIGTGKTLRIFFTRSSFEGLNLKYVLVTKDESGTLIDSSPLISVKMNWPKSAYSVIDEVVNGGYGKEYGNDSTWWDSIVGEYVVISPFDEVIINKIAKSLEIYESDSEKTEFEFKDETLVPVDRLSKHFGMTAVSLSGEVWLFDDQRNRNDRKFRIGFAKNDHWVVQKDKPEAEKEMDARERERDFSDDLGKRLNGQMYYKRDPGSAEYQKLVKLGALHLSRAYDPVSQAKNHANPTWRKWMGYLFNSVFLDMPEKTKSSSSQEGG